MKTQTQLYGYHVKNLRAIDSALVQMARRYRNAIACESKAEIDIYKRLYALILGAWAECKLSKTLFEPAGFSDSERSSIEGASSHLERWHKLVEVAFRKHYSIPKAALTEFTLDHSSFSRLSTIKDILDNVLGDVITLRNKLAHGQWVYPLNSDCNDVSQIQMNALRTENILTLQFKHTILSNLLDAVSDLAVSLPTFERDFNLHFKLITNARINLATRNYAKYAKQMQEKYKRGRSKLQVNTSK